MNVLFTKTAWLQYQEWQQADSKIISRINTLIKNIQRTPFEGVGKPEALRQNFKGYWSRRITSEHRLVYNISEDNNGKRTVNIVACKYHY